MELYEIEGFLRGKCLPGDLLVGESNAQYLTRKLNEGAKTKAEVASLSQQVVNLAVENASMLRLLTDISDNHGEFVNDADDYMYASVPLDYVSEINMYVSRDVNAENPFTATDAAIANIQAQGVDNLATFAGKEYQRFAGDKTLQRKWKGIVLLCTDFASQLRKESNHD